MTYLSRAWTSQLEPGDRRVLEGSSEREQNQAPLRSSLSKKGPRRPRWIELRGCGAQEHLWLWDVGEQEFGRKLQITGIFFHSTNRVRNTESFPPHPWVWAGGELDLVPGSQGANMTVPAARPARPPQAPKCPDAPAAPARALPTSVPTPAPCHSLPSGSCRLPYLAPPADSSALACHSG